MSADVVTVSAVETDVRTRLLRECLPVEAHALLDQGHPLSYVAALFPFTEVSAEAALVAQLRAVADLRYEGQVFTFMEHVSKLSSSKNFSQIRMVRTFGLDGDATRTLAESHVQPAVGSHVVTRFGSSYLMLARVMQVLSKWLAEGDTAFNGEQLVILGKATAFWFAVLDFDWKW